MFTLPLEPMPCPRPRIALRGRFPVAYYPAAYTKWKTEAAELLKDAFNNWEPYDGTVRLEANFFVARPRTSKLAAPRPDIDNYLKSLLDALTQAGFWHDDSQVVEVHASKSWANSGVTPHTSFNITLL